MTSSQFLDQCIADQKNLLQRVENATREVSNERLNQQTVHGDWSPAQVLSHLILSHAPYEAHVKQSLASIPNDSTNAEPRHTWFGAFLSKQAGPGTNIPVPKPFRPGDGPQSPTVLQDWLRQAQSLIEMTEAARGKDLSHKFMRNLMLPLFKMNLADCILLVTKHTERHVLQIEERLAGSC